MERLLSGLEGTFLQPDFNSYSISTVTISKCSILTAEASSLKTVLNDLHPGLDSKVDNIKIQSNVSLSAALSALLSCALFLFIFYDRFGAIWRFSVRGCEIQVRSSLGAKECIFPWATFSVTQSYIKRNRVYYSPALVLIISSRIVRSDR